MEWLWLSLAHQPPLTIRGNKEIELILSHFCLCSWYICLSEIFQLLWLRLILAYYWIKDLFSPYSRTYACLQMIFCHLRAGVSFPPSFISSLNVEIMALETKSIRMIDSLTLAWRLFTFSTSFFRCQWCCQLCRRKAAGSLNYPSRENFWRWKT